MLRLQFRLLPKKKCLYVRGALIRERRLSRTFFKFLSCVFEWSGNFNVSFNTYNVTGSREGLSGETVAGNGGSKFP
jgi:hypothetical protein